MRYYRLNPDKTVEPIEEFDPSVFSQDRTVQYDEFPNETLSTVFLMFDHQWEENGPPLLFETMRFASDGDHIEGRHSTYQEALDFHRASVQAILQRMKDELGTETQALPRAPITRL